MGVKGCVLTRQRSCNITRKGWQSRFVSYTGRCSLPSCSAPLPYPPTRSYQPPRASAASSQHHVIGGFVPCAGVAWRVQRGHVPCPGLAAGRGAPMQPSTCHPFGSRHVCSSLVQLFVSTSRTSTPLTVPAPATPAPIRLPVDISLIAGAPVRHPRHPVAGGQLEVPGRR
jgi:hypothetical protein